jgi:hypothetical protein
LLEDTFSSFNFFKKPFLIFRETVLCLIFKKPFLIFRETALCLIPSRRPFLIFKKPFLNFRETAFFKKPLLIYGRAQPPSQQKDRAEPAELIPIPILNPTLLAPLVSEPGHPAHPLFPARSLP